MKINLLLFFTICFTSLLFSQELIVKSSFENIEHVKDIKWYQDDIYCAGYTFIEVSI